MREQMDGSRKDGLRWFGKTMIYALAAFGFLSVVIALSVLSIVGSGKLITRVPDSAILRINFDNNYIETRGDEFLAEFADVQPHSFFDLVRAISVAADDDRIKAIAATVNVSPLGVAQIQDIVEAIKYFRSKGKEAHIFSDGMGSFGGGTNEYYLASVFDEIWMRTDAYVGITGVHIEVPFFKNVLQKVGIEPEFYARGDYKTAAESLISSDFTPAYKEEMSKVGSGLYNQLAEGIAENRGLEIQEVKDIIDQAPLSAWKAQDLKLIENMNYREGMEDYLANRYDAEVFDISHYMDNISAYEEDGRQYIAFMVLEGVIQNGESNSNPMYEAVVGVDTVRRQLDELEKVENLRALVLRVNSPGGGYAASYAISELLQRFRRRNNVPIVVSMGNYAASGGYFVASAGDYIVAEPATLTGSIGVLGGKIVLEELWKKLGINWGELNYGAHAGVLSVNHKFSPEEREIFKRSLNDVYKGFSLKVLMARRIDNFEDVANGRVWLGKDAVKVNLVDAVGGIDTALNKAQELGGIIPGTEFGLLYYPRRQSLQERVLEFLETGSGLPAVRFLENSGVRMEDFRLFQRLQYDAALPPFKIEM